MSEKLGIREDDSEVPDREGGMKGPEGSKEDRDGIE
jgi:hypothetical protein